MGRKAGTLYINPKKFGNLQKPCMKEMITFLNCLALNHGSDEKCGRQKSQLNACMDAQLDLFCCLHVVVLLLSFCRLAKTKRLGEALTITFRGLTGGENSVVSRLDCRRLVLLTDFDGEYEASRTSKTNCGDSAND
ncbi:CX9C domain-containing protein [Abeliophyllum distichum]|uniref:CX9C domain-containing protein n=1 Tax=Abeliophyllum distichum TaxID=126358 RepID=A0ABD1SV11_9LAMI